MFWTEEDIQPAVDVAIKIFGKVNTYNNMSDHKNVRIKTGEFGTIWFGDVDNEIDLDHAIETLSNTINKKVHYTQE